MGGKIWFRSQEGQGSEFYFTLPFTPVEHEILEAPKEPTPSPSPDQVRTSSDENRNILIVDDTEDNRFLLQTYLRKHPYNVHQASDGEEAFNAVINNHFDLILMDIQMPVMDGYEATRKIREWEKEQGKPPVPIIAVSANAMTEDIQKSIEAGCTEHATKPIKKATLIEMIKKYTES